MESIFRVMIGRETSALGEPLVITTAQEDAHQGFVTEHFIVLPKKDPSLVKNRLRYKVDPDQIAGNILSINDFMSVEIHRSRVWLQQEVLSGLTEEEITMKQSFLPYVLTNVEKSLLVQHRLAGRNVDAITKIRQATHCTELRDYLHSIEKLPKMEIVDEPMWTDVDK